MSNKKEQWGNIELPGLSDEELLSRNWNFAKTQSDKERRSKTVKELAVHRDEIYTERLHQGIALRDNTYQAISNAKPEVQARISASMIGKEKTPEHLAKVAAKNKERGIPCITPLGVFRSGAEAGLAYNEHRNSTNGKNAVNSALKKGKPGYRYITIEEYILLTGKEI
ncbi:MAG: hypothetical protein AC479_06820 [miscellaneous Crenarchaeota group-6 archaeon AD8-1]|nr:MAG: hypothetical protein AC479_06820 [miscellaneous Crenarchaeota group-6 archaeon AD8-1]